MSRLHLKIMSQLFLFIGISSACTAATQPDWGPCPDYLEAKSPLGAATIKVPLDHGTPQGKKLDILVLRALGEAKEKKGQIWFLMGGPGDSIKDFGPVFSLWTKSHPEWDYYAMEHRGTRGSSPLSCPGMPGDSKKCADHLLSTWGKQGLSCFNPSQAAHDLAMVMNAVGKKGRRCLYGVSYGTYLTQRFALLYPDMADALILDGVVPAGPNANGMMAIDLYDQNYNRIGAQIMDACDKDRVCSARVNEFAPSGRALLAKTFDRIDKKILPPGFNDLITREKLRQVLGELTANWWGRMVMPALVYRINRGNERDTAIVNLLFAPEEEDGEDLSNMSLNVFIIASELIGNTSLDAARDFARAAWVSEDETVDQYEVRKTWPIYAPGPETGKWPKIKSPLLILNGTMDPQTPVEYARLAHDRYSGNNTYLIEMPTTTHGALFLSQIKSGDINTGDTCGTRVFFDFLSNPGKRPDAICTNEIIQPDFSGESKRAKDAGLQFFDTDLIWD